MSAGHLAAAKRWIAASIARTCLIFSAAGLLLACGPKAEANNHTSAHFEPTYLGVGAALGAATAQRYGLNLGGPSAWGAEQLLANTVANPGFEPILDRSLVVVEAVGAQEWHRSTGWNTRPAGFWQGARGEVLTGVHVGEAFQIEDDIETTQHERAMLHMDRKLPNLRPGDVVSLLTTTSTDLPARWWGQGGVTAVAGTSPGNAGTQVVRLQQTAGTTTALSSYVDTLERAGRMLPVRGEWELRFWVRTAGDQPGRFRVRLVREGGDVFVDQVSSPGTEWEYVRIGFKGLEASTGRGTLALSFTLVQGTVDFDDVYLGESKPGAGGFRRVVVETLRQLQPGYLREWQGQLGDTLANRLADDTARRPVRYRPGDSEVLHTYSVAQTLALCQAIGARPWLILPTTLGIDEIHLYGKSLRALLVQHGIDQAVVEFGNENWNPLFGAAGFNSLATHTQAAERALVALRNGFGSSSENGPALLTMVNARLGDLATVAHLGQLPAVDRVSVAPYFAYQFNSSDTLASQWAKTFSETNGSDLRTHAAAVPQMRTKLSAYELNLHTTEGDASATLRNALVTGAASGPALAQRLLQGSLAGLAEQAVYSLAGFDAFTGNGDLVRLFGITRDLAWAGHLRPTGIALRMLNSVAGGQAHAAVCRGQACEGITAVAFLTDDRQRWAIVNGNGTQQTLFVAQACAGATPEVTLLDGKDLWLNNEIAPLVTDQVLTTRCNGSDLEIDIPARSLIVVN